MMTKCAQIDNLCLDILNSNHENKGGLRYYPQFSNKLNQYSSTEVILSVMRNYDFRSGIEFIMSLPELWIELNTEDWIYIMEKAVRRTPRIYYDENADYLDILLLSRYFQIDSLGFFMEHTSASLDKKTAVYSVFRRFRHLLAYNRLDLEDLDGEYLVHRSIVKVTATRLVSEGRFVFNTTMKDTEKHLARIKQSLDNQKNS